MAGRNAIQILRGAEQYDPSTSDVILNDGQPFYAKRTHELFVGDGSTPIKNLNPINSRKGLAEEDDLQGKITRIVFDVSSGDEIPFKYNLPGLTKIDWGDGTINTELTHIYTNAGVYECKLYGVTEIELNEEYSSETWVSKVVSISLGDAITTIGKMFNIPIDGTSLPKSLTTIRSNAFVDQAFERVILPDSVTSIDYGAFKGCNRLTSVTIPDSVIEINASAFFNCTSLTSVKIPDGVTSIGGSTFSGCSSLTSITIPDSVTSIGSYAFSGCSSLTSVTIPDSVTFIGLYAFNSCSNLTEMTIPFVGEKKDGTRDTHFGYLFGASSYSENERHVPTSLKKVTITGGIIDSYAFYGCDNLTSVVIPASVTSIGDHAFYYCSSLTSVEIGDSVTSIGEWAFAYCTSLTSITIPDSVTSIGNHTFYSCDSLTSVIIPDSVTSIGNHTFYSCDSLTSVTIPASVTSIGAYAFRNCSSLTSVAIGDSVTSIGEYAFSNCSSLTSVVIGDGVTSIGYSAFSSCFNLTEMTIPFVGATKDGTSDTHFGYLFGADDYSVQANVVPASLKKVTIIGGIIADNAFFNCNSLTSVVIPDSVTSIGNDAFYSCQSLTSVKIGDGVTSIGESAFLDCSSLTSVTIPDSVTSIGSYAFYECYSLTSVTIPDSVTSIGEMTFFGCENLTSVVIGDGVTSIGDEAFSSCSNLTSVVIPGSVMSIGAYAFDGCYSLTSVVIGDGVTSIGDSAFLDCVGLTSIMIPDSVTDIDGSAFCGCSSLTSVVIGKKVDHIRAGAFDNNLDLRTVEFKNKIPCTLANTGSEVGAQQKVFTNCPNLTTIYVPYGCGDAYRAAWARYDIANLIVESDREAMMSDLNSYKAVLYKEQTLTEEEKAQARKNIGAAPEEVEYYVKILMDNFPELMETYLANNAETTPIATKGYVDETVLGGEW